MTHERERIAERQRKAAVNARRDMLLQRARAVMNKARLDEPTLWDPLNVAYAMRPETARFLLENRPDLARRPKDSPTETFWLDGYRVYLSVGLDADEIIVCHSWWPLVDVAPS
jgi:hypothetical protein